MKNAKEILTSSEKFHICLGLERTKSALLKLGNPQNNLKFIHVAGTNGKGSVCAILNEILINALEGKKIGLFTSPHLFSYCERIKINNVPISKNDLDLYINKVQEIEPTLTEFELLTVASFLYFSENNVDIVVLEVGLGGKFDSTNVIENPLATIITTIDLDHTLRLGNTISEIAEQKAGIIKKNCPLVVSTSNLGFEVIKKIAKNVGAKEYFVDDDIKIEFVNGKNFAVGKNFKYEFSLLGDYQAKNLALCLRCVEILPFEISKGIIEKALKSVRWKFRLEYDKRNNILIDGAHNPSGITVLRQFLDKNFKNQKITFLFGCLNNKDYKAMLNILTKDGDELYFNEFDYPNSLKFSQLPAEFQNKFKKTDDPKALIKDHKGLLVVCGSLYMLGCLFNPFN